MFNSFLESAARTFDKFKTEQTRIAVSRKRPLPLKLNIGCGYDKRAGFLNIDIDPACKPDVLFYNHDLSPLPLNYFEKIIAYDVLEHIPRSQTMNALLDWAALLKLNGKLTLQTSDIIGITTVMQENPTFEFQYNWTALMFGNQMHNGDFHFNGFTDRTLRVFLETAGFEVGEFTRTDGWLLSATLPKIADWQQPLSDLRDASDEDFIRGIFSTVFKRNPEPHELKRWKVCSTESARRLALKQIIGSPENLYKRGAASVSTRTVAAISN